MFEESGENGLLNMFLKSSVSLIIIVSEVVHGYLHMEHLTSIPPKQKIEEEVEFFKSGTKEPTHSLSMLPLPYLFFHFSTLQRKAQETDLNLHRNNNNNQQCARA